MPNLPRMVCRSARYCPLEPRFRVVHESAHSPTFQTLPPNAAEQKAGDARAWVCERTLKIRDKGAHPLLMSAHPVFQICGSSKFFTEHKWSTQIRSCPREPTEFSNSARQRARTWSLWPVGCGKWISCQPRVFSAACSGLRVIRPEK